MGLHNEPCIYGCRKADIQYLSFRFMVLVLLDTVEYLPELNDRHTYKNERLRVLHRPNPSRDGLRHPHLIPSIRVQILLVL